jgi:hypothetical protein
VLGAQKLYSLRSLIFGKISAGFSFVPKFTLKLYHYFDTRITIVVDNYSCQIANLKAPHEYARGKAIF